MDKPANTLRFLVIDDLFTRYTILVGLATNKTSVYCNECEEWVASWEGDQLSRHTPEKLLEAIVDEHSEQMRGTPVGIADESTERFI